MEVKRLVYMKSKKGYATLEVIIVMGFVITLAISILILNFQHAKTIKEYAKILKPSIEISNKEFFLYEFKEYLKSQKNDGKYDFSQLGSFNKDIDNKTYSIYYNIDENTFEMRIEDKLNNIKNNGEKYIYNYEIEENEIFFLKVTK